MKKHYEDKIKLFTAIAGSLSVLSANTAEAQTIVVRDINPDAVIDASNSSYDLDIDNNGTVDFEISRDASSSYGVVENVSFYFKGKGSYIGESQPTAGTSNSHTFVSQNGNDWYVAKLNVGDVTSFTTEYNDNPYTRLFKAAGSPLVLTDDFQWTAGSTGYVGVQFTIGTEVHFGWVQLSIANDFNSVTISRVGYETTAGQAIAAGDGLVTSTTTSNANSMVSGRIYASGKTVYFTEMEDDCNIAILNANGGEVYNGFIKSGNSNLNISDISNGVYIVRAKALSGEKTLSQKVFLQK